MNFGNPTWRNRRSLQNQSLPFGTMHYSISRYSTDSDMKSDLKATYCDEELMKRFNAIPEPIRKNLEETVVTVEENNMKKKKISPEPNRMYYDTNMSTNINQDRGNSHRSDLYQSIVGITGVITNFFGAISGAMFQKRSQSPVSQYYECFDQEIERDRERSPSLAWQMSKYDDQNKNERAQEQFSPPNDNMNNCKAAAAHCEDKLTAVRNLLKCPTVQPKPKARPRRPRRVFVEPNSVEEQFEDACSPEDFISLANEDFIEYYTVSSNQNNQLCEVEVPLVQTGVFPQTNESSEKIEGDICQNVSQTLENTIVTKPPVVPEQSDLCTKQIPELETEPNITKVVEIPNPTVVLGSSDNKSNCKQEVITSCEDKMARLKLLLENRKKNTKKNLNSTDSVVEPVHVEAAIQKQNNQPTNTVPIEKKQDKKFKNPQRLSKDKRKHSKLRRTIQEDMLFAQEVDSEELASSVESSPSTCHVSRLSNVPSSESIEATDYFDELKGRFHSTSTTESEDSFQIVFSDNPSTSLRRRKASDCESEDSFIVFEDSPDSCYTSNDVFGDDFTTEGSDSECSDSDSDLSDSGCVSGVPKLSHSFSRTVGNLTDSSLYEEDSKDVGDDDEVDCAVSTLCEVLPLESVNLCDEKEPAKTGLLLTEAKKREKKGQPPKTVSFSTQPPKVHVMRVWAFAARQARAGHWERHSLDRERFKRRIADVDMAVSWVLKPQHRSRVMFQRFMPWWNAQKRIEIAEKKQKEKEEKLRKEESERLELEKKQSETEDKINDIVNVGTIDDSQKEILDGKQNPELTKEPVIVENSIKVVELKKDSSNAVGTLGNAVKKGNHKSKKCETKSSPVIISDYNKLIDLKVNNNVKENGISF